MQKKQFIKPSIYRGLLEELLSIEEFWRALDIDDFEQIYKIYKT